MAEEVIEIRAIHRLYATAIIQGWRKFDSVWETDKPAVKIVLEERGYGLDEDNEIYPLPPVFPNE